MIKCWCGRNYSLIFIPLLTKCRTEAFVPQQFKVESLVQMTKVIEIQPPPSYPHHHNHHTQVSLPLSIVTTTHITTNVSKRPPWPCQSGWSAGWQCTIFLAKEKCRGGVPRLGCSAEGGQVQRRELRGTEQYRLVQEKGFLINVVFMSFGVFNIFFKVHLKEGNVYIFARCQKNVYLNKTRNL